MTTRYSCFWCGINLTEDHLTFPLNEKEAKYLGTDYMPICLDCYEDLEEGHTPGSLYIKKLENNKDA